MRIGVRQVLRFERESPHGWYLEDGDDEVLLPRGQVPPNSREGDELEVFVYTDSEDRPVATIRAPYAEVGEFAALRVVASGPSGAFLDWGLDKDLFCPKREQTGLMQPGDVWVVRLYLDEASGRVACSTRLNRYLQTDGADLVVGQPVSILILEVTARGAAAIIDGRLRGMIFPDEILEPLNVGDRREAYVKQIRSEDGRVALSLRPQGHKAVEDKRGVVFQALLDAGGSLPVSDHSSPDEIYRRFGLSKAAFKRLIGGMYRDGVLEILKDSIRLK